jgi:hypothetical protein
MESTYMIVYGRATSVQGPYTTREGRDFKSGHFTVLLERDYDENREILHAGMGCSGFFWDNDTLFMSYHTYTPPTGDALLNIRPVYLDADGWLTMNPDEGTLISGGQSGIREKIGNTVPAFPAHTTIRSKFISGNTKVNSGTRKYSLTGKRCTITGNGHLPTGIYIEQQPADLR